MAQTEKQAQALRQALIRGKLLELVEMRGGTGELRKPLTKEAYEKRKKRAKMAKDSRKGNR
jgi:hypothetical protein